MTTVKITELTDIGANLATSTVVPVVNMAGTPTTQKTNIGNIANIILEGAGVDYPEASVALLAQTVSNAAQPNITSVGTLTNVVVSGNASINGNITSNGTAYLGNISTTGEASITTLVVGSSSDLGSVNNIIIEGGIDGQVLTTDGDGNLSWTTVSGGNGVPSGSNTQIQFNDAGAFGGNTGFTFNKTTGTLATPLADVSGIANVVGGGATVATKSVLNVASTFGSNDANDPASAQAVRGRVTGSNLTNTRNYVTGVTGQYLITGTNASEFIKAGVLGVVGDQTTTADGAVVAYLDGDGGLTTANAAYAVSMKNSTPNSGFNYGLDLQFIDLNLGGVTTSTFKQADIRFNNGVKLVANTAGNISINGNLMTSAEVVANGIIQSGTGFSTGGYLSVNGNTDLHDTTITGNLSATGYFNLSDNSYIGNIEDIGATGFNMGANTDFAIRTTDGNTSYAWEFGVNGEMTVPDQANGQASIVSLLGNSALASFLAFATPSSPNLVLGTTGNNHVIINTDKANANVRWNFDDTGNLTLPGNTFAVNYANGTAVTIPTVGNIATINLTGSNSNVLYGNGVFAPAAGGNANTGNVTFNDINIIGTGNLKLQPDSANANAYLDIYLTGGPDIHIAGNGETVILGTDDYANVAVNIDGNVSIQAGNVGGTQTWNFGTDGTLTFPDGGGIYNNGSTQFYGAPNSQVSVSDYDGYNQFFSYPGNGAGQGAFIQSSPDLTIINTWQFGVDGTLTLPQGSQISETANTSVNITANANTWAFGVDGNLTVPGSLINDTSIVLSAPAVFNICTIATAGSGYNTGSSLKATTGGSGSGMTVGIGYGLSNQLTSVSVVNPGTGYVNGDVITVSEGTGGTFVITKYNVLANQTNNNTVQTDLIFANNTLTIPVDGNLVGNLIVPGSIISSGASPAPYISGFSSVSALQFKNGNSNVTVNANSNLWTFDSTGNLTLPANTFAVNYANGTQVSIGGGGNTGNVTFDDNIIMGTGDEFGGDGLFLAPGNGSIANSAVQYLRVRGGDFPTHIHLDTGNNQYYDQYFGADGRYVKLEANGNVVINADDYLGNSATWTLTIDGNLILAGGNSVIQSIANSSLDTLNPNVSTMVLTPDQNYNSQSLVLDPTLPGHIHLRAYAFSNIDEPSANIFLGGEDTAFEITSGANNQAVIHSNGKAWTFGDDGNISSDTLTFTTTFANVKTVEYQTAGVWDLYVEDGITGSNTAASRLNVSFKDNLIDKPQVYIENTKESDGIALRWTFDENGNLNFPRDVAGNSDPYLNIFGGSTPTIQSTDASLAGPANLAIQSDYLNLSGSTGNRIILQADAGAIATDAAMVLSTNLADPGNIVSWTLDTTGNLTLPDTTSVLANVSITLEANDTGNITGLSLIGDSNANLYAHGNVTIVSDNSNTTATWTFGADGNLTIPGNLVIAGNTSVFGTNASLLQTTDDRPLIALSSGANGAVSSLWVEDIGNVGTSNIAAVYANPTSGSKIVRIAVGQNGGNTGPNLWDFDTTGNLTLPTGGHIIVSGGIVGGGASPAPYISGFDSIGALEFTNGNSNVTVTANATSWTFGTDGLLTLPEGGIVTNNIPPVTFDILYQYDDLEWDGITVTFTNASSTYMLGVLALMQTGDPITLVGPGGPISTTVAIPYTGGSAGYFTVTEANSPIQITQFTLPNRLPSVTGIKLTTNAKNYLFTEAGVTQSPVLTVDTLPSGQYAVAGFRAFVSDANLAPVGNFGEIVGNSGSNTVCVWCDGTNWRIG
jgi:hypothetical protein